MSQSQVRGQVEKKKGSSALPSAIFLAGIAYAYQQGLFPGEVPAEWREIAVQAVSVISALCGLSLLLAALRVRGRFKKALAAEIPKASEASARIATVKDIEEAGLVGGGGLLSMLGGGKKEVEFYAGVVGQHVLMLPNDAHTLIVAPTAAGKNTKLLFPYQGLIEAAMLINDPKAENEGVSARYRESVLGQEIIVVNAPKRSGRKSHSYNPIDIIIDDLAAGGQDVFNDARMIASALLPEPKGSNAGANKFFRQNGRDLIAFAMISLAVEDPQGANLPTVQQIVQDPAILMALAEQMQSSTALSGDLAGLASSILAMASKGEKQFQDFINEAKTAMAPYMPSGILAPLTKTSTFRYRDLVTRNAQGKRRTIYQHFDNSRKGVFVPFGSMLNACALLELQRAPRGEPVVFLNDEAGNMPVDGLPQAMTIVRGSNVRIVNVFQSYTQMDEVFGREGGQMIRDNSPLSIAFGLAEEDAKRVSTMIGMQNALQPSFSMGTMLSDPIQESRGTIKQPVRTADQVRRSQHAFVRYKDKRTMEVSLPGYHEMEPFRSKFDPNPMYGGKRFRGKKKVIF